MFPIANFKQIFISNADFSGNYPMNIFFTEAQNVLVENHCRPQTWLSYKLCKEYMYNITKPKTIAESNEV